MDVLESIIRSLTSDEVRRFKILSNRFKTGEKKLVNLFDAIRGAKFEQEDDLVKDLYGNTQAQTRNRYYRLRNKLLENICKSLVLYHYKSSDEVQAIYDYQTAVLMRQRGEYELAHYFLKKADRKADAMKQYGMLEMIFDEFAELALLGIDIDTREMLQRYQAFKEELAERRSVNRALSEFKYLMMRSRIGRVNGNIIQHVQDLKNELMSDRHLLDRPDGQVRLSYVVLQALIEKGSAHQVADYLGYALGKVSGIDFQDPEISEIFLQLRLAELDSLLYIGEWQKAMEITTVLEKEIHSFSGKQKRKFNFLFLLRKMDSLDEQGMNKEFEDLALQSLSMLPEGSGIEEKHSIHYRLARHWFSLEQYKKAIDSVARITKDKDFNALGEPEKMYLEILRITSLYHLGDYVAAQDAARSFRKDFRKLLKDREHRRSSEFMTILARMIEAPLEGKKVSINSAVRKYEARCNAIAPHSMELFDPLSLLIAYRDGKTYLESRKDRKEKQEEEINGTPVEEFGSLTYR